MQALDVACMAGIEVHRHGVRWWAKCPLHGERTASMCFFPDGKWKCFGCGAYGDAADLYAALYHVSLGEALRTVKGDDRKPRLQKPTVNDLRSLVLNWKSEKWHDACTRLHTAETVITAVETQRPDTEMLWEAVRTEAYANDTLTLLETATPRQLLHMMREDQLS